jgi:hypothetical protein
MDLKALFPRSVLIDRFKALDGWNLPGVHRRDRLKHSGLRYGGEHGHGGLQLCPRPWGTKSMQGTHRHEDGTVSDDVASGFDRCRYWGRKDGWLILSQGILEHGRHLGLSGLVVDVLQNRFDG